MSDIGKVPQRRVDDYLKDPQHYMDQRKIGLLITIRALCIVILMGFMVLAVVLGYTLSSVNNVNTNTKKGTSIVCNIIANAPITLPSDCRPYVPLKGGTTTTITVK